VTHTGLELKTLLPQPPKGWDYKTASPHPVKIFINILYIGRLVKRLVQSLLFEICLRFEGCKGKRGT
jgi:hypothetical protein